jgi:hypothetical protein
LFVLVKEFVIYSIIAHATMDTLEINVNSLNVMESIQPIQMFVPVKEIAVYLTIVLVK